MGDKKIDPFDFYIDEDPTMPFNTAPEGVDFIYVDAGEIPMDVVRKALSLVLEWENGRMSLHSEAVLKALMGNDQAVLDAAIEGHPQTIRDLTNED